jgi:succinate-semialdehyde dehydrogenase/glutarate-semialdehyde dehydrogenase
MLSALLGAQLLEEAGFPKDLWQVVAAPARDRHRDHRPRRLHLLHRLDRDRQAHRQGLRRAADRLLARARRQEPDPGPARRRPREGRRGRGPRVRSPTPASSASRWSGCSSPTRSTTGSWTEVRGPHRGDDPRRGLDWGNDMGSLISQDQLDTVTAHVDDAVAKGATVLTGGRPGPTSAVLLRADHPRGRHAGHDLLRQRDLRAGRVALPLPRRDRGGRAGQRGRVRPQRLDLQPGRPPRGRAIAREIKCGTVNINEAFGATFGSIDSPMGGMRQSGLGRRQGAEGIHRYTETQSVAPSG